MTIASSTFKRGAASVRGALWGTEGGASTGGQQKGVFRKDQCQYLHRDDPVSVTHVKEIEEDGSPSREEPAEDNENMIGGDLEDILIVQSNNQNNTESVINCNKKYPSYICDICGLKFKTERTKKEHINSKHREYTSSIQIGSFEEQKLNDIEKYDEIEQLIRECRKDLDSEDYDSDSDGKEGVDMDIESSEKLHQFGN